MRKYTENIDRQIDQERPLAFYKQLMADVGLDEDNGNEIHFTGPNDPLVDSPYFIAEGFSAILGAVGMANAIIWRMRGGEKQKITINRKDAFCHLYRTMFLKQNDYPIKIQMNVNVQRLHKVKDGFIETTACFRHLEDGLLELLDCVNTKQAVDKAYMKWEKASLEKQINRRGLCGTAVRTREEWRAHPQGKALLNVPLVTIEKIAEGEPIPFKVADRPLGGIKVLDLTHVLAGPLVGNVLAEQGADILHIAAPDREQMQNFVMDTGFGKRSAYLNLKDTGDAERLKGLVRDNCDVFVQSYRANALGSLGFSSRELAQLCPGIIYVDVSCYGHVGPWANYKGFENLAQACTGILAEHGTAESPGMIPAFLLNDTSTGFLGALGALVALIRRACEGGSYRVRVSLCRTAMWYQDLGLVSEKERERYRGHCSEELQRAIDPHIGDGFNDNVELLETDTPWGRLTHVAPVIKYSKTPGYWEHPSVPLGCHRPDWPVKM